MIHSIQRLFKESKQSKTVIYLGFLYLLFGVLGFIISYFIGQITQSTTESNVTDMANNLIILTIVSILAALLSWYINSSIIKVKQFMMATFRTKTAESLIEGTYESTHMLEQGDIIGRLTNDVSSISTASSMVLIVIKAMVLIIIICMGMFVLDVRLALVYVASLPIVLFVQYRNASKTIKNVIPWKTAMGQTDATAQDLLNNRTTIKSFNLHSTSMSWLSKDLENIAKKGIKGIGTLYIYSTIAVMLNFLPFFFVGGLGLFLLQEGSLQLGTLISVIMLTTYMDQELNNLQNTTQNIPQLLASTTRIFPIWDAEKEQSGTLSSCITEQVIKFDKVSFAYPKQEDIHVLNEISFTVHKGEKIGIVGTSGSGKSTIFKLLTKFYLPTSGELDVYDTAIQDWDTTKLRKQFGMISQTSYVFDTSMKENLLYAKKETSDEELLDVLNRAKLGEFVTKHGLDYVVGERGSKLSGGQRQRLALARTLLIGAKILLFDEATSALDNQTEKEIQTLMMDMQDKTQIVIAHRLSTITQMDRILVLDQGKIVEEGNHETLLARSGIYASLYEKEMSIDGKDEK